MRTKYTVIGLVGVVVGVLLSSAVVVLAGNLNPPSGPTDAASQMHTLEQIYQRLNTGAEGTKMTTFTESASGPGTGTMHTLDDIMDKAPAADNTDGAVPAEVRVGKTYWGPRAGGTWGPQTGGLHGGCTCTGTPNGTRWCDNLDGTVTDLTTCLVWLKDANCTEEPAGVVKGSGSLTWTDAIVWSGVVDDGKCGLSDGSVQGDWWLPTLNQFFSLTRGIEPVLADSPRAFTGVEANPYWSRSTMAAAPANGLAVNMDDGNPGYNTKSTNFYVWPVRGGK